MTARVAFPVLYSTLRLLLEKGRQWTVFEHILLDALVKQPQTATDLAQKSNLPRSVVIEALIRMMRVGWIEIHTETERMVFRSTVLGRAAADHNELPVLMRPVTRGAGFVVDCIAGAVFRSRDLQTLYTPNRINALRDSGAVRMIDIDGHVAEANLTDVLDVVLDEDEKFNSVSPSSANPTKRFGVVTVRGDNIDGLPANRIPSRLKDEIFKAANESSTTTIRVSAAPRYENINQHISSNLTVLRSGTSLIMGGDQHRECFVKLLRQSQQWAVIHSTFLRIGTLQDMLPEIHNAASRGVRIDVLWGESDDTNERNRTKGELTACRQLLNGEGLSARVRFHPFSTKSHAKILLADTGDGGTVSVIGSCNWLYTGFSSFEISARFNDPSISAEIAHLLSLMSTFGSGKWTTLTADLAAHARMLRGLPAPAGNRVKASLILGASHNDYMLRARDEAENRIVVGSHRLGISAQTAVLFPATAAASDRPVNVDVYYGTPSGPVDGKGAADLTRSAADSGLRIRRIYHPRLHAKFLAWDDNHAVITSQNWLSADPPDAQPYNEVGVYVEKTGIAREVIEHVKHNLQGA